jgi:tetratricopeptide (TPR) repeat protein
LGGAKRNLHCDGDDAFIFRPIVNYRALDFYNQALPLWRSLGDRKFEAATLNSLGQTHDLIGEKQKALDFYNQAPPLLSADTDRATKARLLNIIGVVYNSLFDRFLAITTNRSVMF